MERLQFSRASWALLDQAIVSLGTFALNVLLARNLAVADYGRFALLFGIFLTLQLFNSSLLFHPLSVSLFAAKSGHRGTLLTTTAILTIGLSVSLGTLLAIGLLLLHQNDILVPAVASFVLWQLQEGARRGLLAEFRHKTAMLGDAIAYLGQGVVAIVLVLTHSLTLANCLYGMAAMSAIACVLQAMQVRLSLSSPREIRSVAHDFWSSGRWVLAYNFVALLRLQPFPWVLAATSGASAAAFFQAALNIANLANPIVLGLCNVIPQTAAQARAEGLAASWKAAQKYALMGMPLAFCYYLLALALPEFALRAFYGANSPYIVVSAAAQLLVFAMMLNYWADMAASFLNGVNAGRTALNVNLIATAAAFLLGLALIPTLGLVGCCLAAVGANAVRLAFSFYALSHFVAADPRSTSPRWLIKRLPDWLPKLKVRRPVP